MNATVTVLSGEGETEQLLAFAREVAALERHYRQPGGVRDGVILLPVVPQ
ncbi:hypothetical protein OHA25_61120 (plasmid) [Nonomuraea sp. NBC_00507]